MKKLWVLMLLFAAPAHAVFSVGMLRDIHETGPYVVAIYAAGAADAWLVAKFTTYDVEDTDNYSALINVIVRGNKCLKIWDPNKLSEYLLRSEWQDDAQAAELVVSLLDNCMELIELEKDN